MCGIAGFAGLQDRALLEAMTDALAHRGPDDRGFHHEGEIGLGSRRLAVIDLEGGRQPMTGGSGAVAVFNGEIYNFKSLRLELERRGHRFKTRSDTEVLVRLYEERGVDAFGALAGMFAVAIWDPRSKELVLARDHVGVKPLYVSVRGTKLYFGSELRALRRVPDLPLEIDPGAIAHYLDYLYVPAPRSIYRGVEKLPPGSWLRWRAGRIERGTYWRPIAKPRPIGLGEALEELDLLLGRVVREQAVADVPLGLFLSGGLDSTALALYLVKAGLRPKAYCIYFPEGGERFNELDRAVRAASILGLELKPLPVRPDVSSELDPLVAALDEPLGDSSALPSYWVSRETRRDATVALSGIGGDELFGGYPRYQGARLLETYQRLPRALRAALAGVAAGIPDQLSSRNVTGWARRFLSVGALAPEDAYARWMGHLSPGEKAAAFTQGLSTADGVSAPRGAFDAANGDLSQRILGVDLTTYLPDDLLALADRTSMASSLEVRVPLCDPRLVEFALGLPSDLRVGRCALKPLLKALLQDELPPSIVRQKKQGFMVPLGVWFSGALRPALEDALATFGRRGLVEPAALRRLFDEHLSGRRARTDVLWSCLVLERWLRLHHPDWRLA
ncbi:MAG: asparagine synthase (glutamine-hydrolyzing) [Elusimicrobia bacterium]|nr:asparagine synthase (glutamine-hydrolyzing) [Elusimicrobiota bacterium]